MVNKVNKDAFKKLKKLKPAKRMEMARSPVGQSMLSLLTPSQFADLFPRYYEQGLPNVEGFRKAISKKSQQKQQDILTGLASGQGSNIEQAEKAGRTIREGGTGGGGRTGGYGDTGPVSKATMMKYAMDQLRKEGVPEGNLRAAAAHLVGQAYMESGLNPNKSHDQGTGFGIYGARLGRRTGMFNWLSSNGYANNSAEGQMRYMAHEAMSGKYSRTRNVLMRATAENFESDSYTITDEFEAPKVNNYRAGAVKAAFGSFDGTTPTGPSQGTTPSQGAGATSDMVGKSFTNAKGKTECVTYAQQAGGVGHTSGWTPGQHAKGGGLKQGDWIATFQDGKYTNTYGQSHVARFESYIFDKGGNIIGMNVSHQYNKSGKVIQGQFMFGSGDEFDANNYYQIHDQGRPASMRPSDATDTKVQDRKQYFKENPQADDSTPRNTTSVKTQPAVAAPPPPMPHPAASSPTTPTATVNKPIERSYMLDQDALVSAIKQTPEFKKQAGDIPDFMIPNSRVVRGFLDDKRTQEIMKKSGTTIDEATGKVTSKNPDLLLKSFGVPTEGVLKPIDKRSETQTNKQTAALDQDAHFIKAAYKPTGDMAASKKFEDFDRETLLASFRMKETGSYAGKYNSNAKAKGGARGAYQFQDKTWAQDTKRTGIGTQYKKATDAPPHIQDEVMYQKLKMDYDKHGSLKKAIYTHYSGNARGYMSPKALRNNNNQTAQMYAQGILNHAQNFPQQNKDVASTAPTNVIPLQQTRPQQPSPTTPKPTVEPPKPSTTDRIAKEIFQGGGKGAEAAPAKPAAPTTPTTTPTPVTPAAPPAPPTNGSIRTEPVLNVDNPVRGASNGGSFDANGTVSIRPMDRKDDHALISNNGGRDQVIGTVQSGERIDVTPQQKVSGNMGPTDNGLRGEFEALRQEIGNNLSNAGEPVKQQSKTIQQREPDRNVTKFNAALNDQNKNKQWHNDAFARAMNRTRLQETGDPLNNHFSGGNTNYG